MHTTKPSRLFRLATVTLILVVGGCAATNTTVRISGTPGAEFTAQYQAGTHSGSVTTSMSAGGPGIALEMPGRDLTCDVSKTERSSQLILEIRQAGQTVFRAEAPAGTQGVRVSHTLAGWRQETY